MATNKNFAPYFDDFDEFKNFHQILFKPGYAVQARELSQIQSILKNQIEKFGNHIFQQGSIVIPGNSRGEIGVPYVKLNSSYVGTSINYAAWEGQTIVGVTSGVTAIVKKAIAATGTDPITLYLNYTSGGTGGKITFDQGENIYQFNSPSVIASIKNEAGAIGTGSLAYINTGVYYVNGTFVTVNLQSVVISKYDTVPSCRVLLQIVEDYVTVQTDSSLLDPAQGSYNFSAPGADRYKLSLVLTTLPLTSTISENYIQIMLYNAGVLQEHARNPRYNELEKSLARRTYDESGDYVVSGLTSKIAEHKRVATNGGISVDGSSSNFAIKVSPGKAYIGGFETEKLAETVLIQPKARTAAHVKTKEFSIRPSYGRAIYISNVRGTLPISTRGTITLLPFGITGTPLGTARVLAVDFQAGDMFTGSDKAVYKLWITELTFISATTSMDDVGGLTFSGGSAFVIQVLNAPNPTGTAGYSDGHTVSYSGRTATVKYWDSINGDLYVYKHTSNDSPKAGDIITNNNATTVTALIKTKKSYFGSDQNSAIFTIPAEFSKSLKNSSFAYTHTYTVQVQLSMVFTAGNNQSVSITNGVMRTPEPGTFIAFNISNNTSIVPLGNFSLSGGGTTLTLSGAYGTSGTIAIFATVDKTATTPRTKTIFPGATESLSLSGGSVTLAKADVYRINSITDGGVVVTQNYTLNTNQTDYAYYRSSITLKAGAPSPSGALIINYDYFTHSTGDFFIYDSYSSNSGYEDYVLEYVSTTSGSKFNLKNCIDCRPIANSTNDFGSGAIVGDMLVSSERFYSASLQYYVPRIDVLTIDKTGALTVVSGTPAEIPAIPDLPPDTLALDGFYIGAYTDTVLNIITKRAAVDRYTMKDIAKISNRISRLEEFSTLSAVESSLINYNIVDATSGLNRFKTGYLVETFKTPLTIANIYDASFSSTIHNGTLKAAAESMVCPATVKALSNAQNTNGFISLPYTETALITQPVSSRVTNLNPFLIIKWSGSLALTPDRDVWVEQLNTPDLVINKTETVTVVRWIPAPPVVNRHIATMPVVNALTAVESPGNDGGRGAVSSGFDGTLGSGILGSDKGGADAGAGGYSPGTPGSESRDSSTAEAGNVDGGGGGGGSSKIICTALYEMGLMSKEVYEIDQLYGKLLYIKSPQTMAGYHRWATTVVKWMQRGDWFGKMVTSIANAIATPWSTEMSRRMDISTKFSITGWLLMEVGLRICKRLGRI